MDKVRTDLMLHFLYGSMIAFFLININLWYGFGIAVLISVLKEVVYDKLMKKGTFDWLDLAFGIAPAVMLLLTRMNGI